MNTEDFRTELDGTELGRNAISITAGVGNVGAVNNLGWLDQGLDIVGVTKNDDAESEIVVEGGSGPIVGVPFDQAEGLGKGSKLGGVAGVEDTGERFGCCQCSSAGCDGRVCRGGRRMVENGIGEKGVGNYNFIARQ